MEAVGEPRGEAAQEGLGKALARALEPGTVLHLAGPIGAGKTTLVRGLLRGLGVDAAVKSPTYTLVESYITDLGPVHHFDLYRLADPEELQFFGAEEYFYSQAICILEWPEKAGGILPPPDLVLEADYQGPEQRRLRLIARSERGEAILARMGDVHGNGQEME
jgi:tRNA threonylcarbamoyladenosine biosynthesis protein TsaE